MKAGPVLVVLAAAAACAVALGSLFHKGTLPYRGYAGAAVVVIEPGEPARLAAERLQKAGVVRSALVFRVLMRLRGADGKILAGEYRFEGEATPQQVLDKLVRGDVIRHKLTIPEGFRVDEIARIVGASGLADGGRFLEVASGTTGLIADLDPEARDLEGYLFPDTYHVPRGLGETRLVDEMIQRFRRELTPERLSRMQAMGLTLRQTLTLASLVEEEARLDEERPRIAAVFHNRLRLGMPLQCDPTVVYALVRDGRYRGDIFRSDLSYASPYNTYATRGLPPGPICSPGARSIDAVLNPAATADLYFVVSGQGRHQFSTNIRDHSRAVQRYRARESRR